MNYACAVLVLMLVYAIPSECQVRSRRILTFTDSATYNANAHAGSPLGLLESQSARATLDLEYQGVRWEGKGNGRQSVGAFAAPRLVVGQPGAALFEIHYRPGTADSSRASMLLHRFGFSLTGGVLSGSFQAALKADGFTGAQALDAYDGRRWKSGVDELSLHLGSQLHELVRIGFSGGASGFVDTLYDQSNGTLDRFFSGHIPEIGAFADFGAPQFPVRSNFALKWGTSRFIYANRSGLNLSTTDRNAIEGDSLFWAWQTMAGLPHGKVHFQPALQVAYRGVAAQIYAPSEDNDNPMLHGDPLEGQQWRTGSLVLGFGTSARLGGSAGVTAEYTVSTLRLDAGEFWPESVDRDGVYHGFAVEATGNPGSIAALSIPQSMAVEVRAGVFNRRHNTGLDPWWGNDLSMLYTVGPGSQDFRYREFGLGSDERVVGLTLGAGASVLNGMLSGDLEIAKLSRTGALDWSGFGFSAGLTCALR